MWGGNTENDNTEIKNLDKEINNHKKNMIGNCIWIILCIVFLISVNIYITNKDAIISTNVISTILLIGNLIMFFVNRYKRDTTEIKKMTKEMKEHLNEHKLVIENSKKNVDITLSKLQEMLVVEDKILQLDTELDQQKLEDEYNKIISKFESSLLKMEELENDKYLKKYTEYKNEMNTDLTILLQQKKDLLKELINGNIYIQTIKKYNKEIDNNKNNINQLFNHFINYFIKKFNDNPGELFNSLDDNLIKNLNKLKDVIFSMKDNISYKILFNNLIKGIAYKNEDLNRVSDLNSKLIKLEIDYETLIGKGEVSGKDDSKIMQCLNLIKSKLIPIDELDTLKTRSYNNLINITNDYYIHKKIDWHKYVTNIKPLFNKFEENEILNWIKTCIIPNNN